MKKGTAAVLSAVVGVIVGAAGIGWYGNKQEEEKGKKVEKFRGYYNILNQWMILKQEGKCLSKYFETNNYKTIAIYGMGEMGGRLYEELKNTQVEVKYVVDKNAAYTFPELNLVDIEDDFEEVDVMVVTATFAFEEIETEISDKVTFPIVSLEDVVYEI